MEKRTFYETLIAFGQCIRAGKHDFVDDDDRCTRCGAERNGPTLRDLLTGKR